MRWCLMSKGIPFSQAVKGRKLEDLHMNELRMRLDLEGIKYKDNASKADLIVKYFLTKGCYDIITLNETLLYYGEKPFGPA